MSFSSIERGGTVAPFRIDATQLASSNKRFPPAAVGPRPTAAFAAARTGVEIDGTNDPGVELWVTLLPAPRKPGFEGPAGVRRIAGKQIVTARVGIAFDEDLPISWMASVLRIGDARPNQSAQPYSSLDDDFDMPFGPDLLLTHENGAWNIPHFDSTRYEVTVGFGLGTTFAAWAYSVPCGPGQSLRFDAGSYQLVRSNGEGEIGDPIAPGSDYWSMPRGFSYSLIFDQDGTGTLTRSA